MSFNLFMMLSFFLSSIISRKICSSVWYYRKVNCRLSTHISRSFCLQTSRDLRWYPSDNRRQRVSCWKVVKCGIVYFIFSTSPPHHSRHIWPSFLITATAQRRHEQKEIIERADKCHLPTVELNGRKKCVGHSLLHKEAFEHRRKCMWAWTRRRSVTIGRNERQVKFLDWLQPRVSIKRSLSTDTIRSWSLKQ